MGYLDLACFAQAAILFFAHNKNCPRVPEWHQADSCSGHVGAPESTKSLVLPQVHALDPKSVLTPRLIV